MRHFLFALVTAVLLTLPAFHAHAWGKRGHSIFCETAAILASSTPKGDFLKSHSYDLGYYCNVPDIVWKKPDTYKIEWTNHFMDLEIFERGFKGSSIAKPFEMDRQAFNAAFPEIKDEAGRAYWRVRELEQLLNEHTNELKKTTLSQADRHKAQANWLVVAGAIGHYIGDLSQPLHVTENYDGQLTEQKGVHAYFEDTLVDELFAKGTASSRDALGAEVMKRAGQQWPSVSKKLAGKSTLELMQSLAESSNKALPSVLKLDKKVGRKDDSKAAQAHREQIITRLAMGSMTLAELWRRQLGWEYDGQKFYTFVSEPAFIAPPKAPAATPTPAAK